MNRLLRGLRALAVASLFATGLSVLTSTEAEAQGCGWMSLDVTPCETVDTLFIQANDYTTFQVQNWSANSYWIVEPVCSGTATNCWVDEPFLYLPLYSTASVTLGYTGSATAGPGVATLWVHDGGYEEATGTVNVAVRNHFAVTVAQPSATLHPLTTCADGCFAARYAHSTVPYFTLNTPRSATVVYDGERAHPMPFLALDVELIPGAPAGAIGFDLAAQFTGGANLTFINGTAHQVTSIWTPVFAGTPVRLWGQVDLRSYSTGRYPITVTVTVTYSNNTTETAVINTALVVVNDANSSIAPGWSVAGVQRLYFPSGGGYLVVENGGPAVFFENFWTPASDRSTLDYNSGTQLYTRTYLDGSKVTFTANGRMYEAIGRAGLRTRLAYHPSGHLQAIYEPTRINGGLDNIYLEFLYSGGTTGTLTTIRERKNSWTGRSTSYTVGTAGITAITDPDGYHTAFTYDGSGRLKTITDRKGALRKLAYDAATWVLRWDSLPAVPVDNGSGGTTTGYPAVEYRPWLIEGNGSTSLLQRDMLYARVFDPIGREVPYRTNAWGQVLVRYGFSGGMAVAYDAQGRPIRVEDFDTEVVDSLVYNSDHLVTAHYAALGAGSPTFYRYGVYAQVDSMWGPATRAERRFLNAATGNVDSVRIARPSGQAPGMVRYVYDAWGRQTSVKDEANHLTYTHYDALLGNVDSTLAPGNRWSRVRFDIYGRDSTTSGPGRATATVVYDVMNRATQVYDGLNATPTTVSYDALYQAGARNAKGELADSAAYNALGWVTTRYDTYNPALALTYRYDKAGQLTSYTNRRGQRVNLTYNVLGALASKSGDNTTTDSLTTSSSGDWQAWNAHARLDGVYDPETGTSTLRTIFGTDTFRVVTDRPADFAGVEVVNITTSVPGLTFKQRAFHQDPATGARAAMNVGIGTAVGFTYNADRLRTSTTYQGQAYSRSEAYTSLHQRNEAGYTSYPVVDNLFRRRYHYDALGRIDQRLAVGSSAVTQHFFQYDSLGRLQAAQERTGCGSAVTDSASGYTYSCSTLVTSTTYSYDAVGNRTDNGGTYAAGNRMTQFKGYTFEYDADGNITRQYNTSPTTVDRRYTWSAEGLLLQVKNALTNDSVTYAYDARGRPARRRTNGALDRYWVYDEKDQLLIELDGSRNRIADYVYEPGIDRPFMTMTGAQTPSFRNYHVVDELGNVIGQHDDFGIVQHTAYDPWGVPTTSYSTENKLLWKGLHYERGGALGSTGLYYMRARWYDPDLGRFMSEDPIGIMGGLNQYAYAGNDPVNRMDPSGTCYIRITTSYADGSPDRVRHEYVPPGRGHYFKDEGLLFCQCDDVTWLGMMPLCWPGQPLPTPSNGPAKRAQNVRRRGQCFGSIPDRPQPLTVSILHANNTYQRYRTIRQVMHFFFPGEANSDQRHFHGTYLSAKEFGALLTWNAGVANEMYGLVALDLPRIRDRLSGRTPWAFQAQDFVSNARGIYAAMANTPCSH